MDPVSACQAGCAAGLGDLPTLEKVFAAADNSSACSAAPRGNGTAAAAPDTQVEGPSFYRCATLAFPTCTHSPPPHTTLCVHAAILLTAPKSAQF